MLHDPAAVQVTLGPLPITGFAAGSFCDYAYDNADAITYVPGVNGGGHVKSTNAAGSVTLTLHPDSKSLPALLALRKATMKGGGNVKGTLVVADLSGADIITLAGARLVNRPGGSYSDTGPSSRVFRFHGKNLEVNELGFPEA
jgi:hypothetical protein